MYFWCQPYNNLWHFDEILYLWFTQDLDRTTMYPKFNTIGVQTHDLKIIDGTCHVHKILTLTTEPSGTIKHTFTYIKHTFTFKLLLKKLTLVASCLPLRTFPSVFVQTDEAISDVVTVITAVQLWHQACDLVQDLLCGVSIIRRHHQLLQYVVKMNSCKNPNVLVQFMEIRLCQCQF